MPRSCSKSSTLRSESGNRTYNITARRMISGLVLKYLKGERFVIQQDYETALRASSWFLLTAPVVRIMTGSPRGIGKSNTGRIMPIPGPVIAGQCPEVASLGFLAPRIENRRDGFVYYPAGDCVAICREGMNSLLERFGLAINALNTGFSSKAAFPTQDANVERSRSIP